MSKFIFVLNALMIPSLCHSTTQKRQRNCTTIIIIIVEITFIIVQQSPNELTKGIW